MRAMTMMPNLPWYIDSKVVLQNDLHPAAGDIDDRGHGNDIANADNDGGGNGHHGAKGFADESDERACGSVSPFPLVSHNNMRSGYAAETMNYDELYRGVYMRMLQKS